MNMAEGIIQVHVQMKARRMSDFEMKTPRNIPKTTSQSEFFRKPQNSMKRGQSFVAGHKLRESKWFKSNEINIVCAVVESGFILERHREGQENIYGIAMWNPGYEKSKDSDQILLHTLTGTSGKHEIVKLKLLEFWTEGSEIRINNKNDKDDVANQEEIIRKQLKLAEKRKFNNSEHFAYFCRYEQATETRMRKLTTSIWGPSSILAKLRTRSLKSK